MSPERFVKGESERTCHPTLELQRFFFRSKRANARLFYPGFIPMVRKTVRLDLYK